MKRVCLFALITLLSVMSASAFDTTPLQISLWAPNAQIVPEETTITFLKLNLPYGGNKKITGIDLGLASRGEDVAAFQANLLLNQVKDEFTGFQLSLINETENSYGFQIGALMNVTANQAKGLQIGLVNSALDMRGLQIGIINYSEFMVGFQVGLINIIKQSNVCFFPLVNFCF